MQSAAPRPKSEQAAAALPTANQGPSPPSQSNKRSRDELFAALEHGNPILRPARSIRSPDDLDAVELKRCFEILHACGQATDYRATLGTTRAAMEGFLDAVFAGWDATQEPSRPTLEFVAHATAPFGYICTQAQTHRSAVDCKSSQTCRGLVYALAAYRSISATLEIGMCVKDRDSPLASPDQEPPEPLNPSRKNHVYWIDGNQSGLIRYYLMNECISKIEKQNKHLAIWHTRKLVRGWAKGNIFMGDDAEVLAFSGLRCLGVLATLGPVAYPKMGDD